MLRNTEEIQRAEDLGLLYPPALWCVWRWLYLTGSHVEAALPGLQPGLGTLDLDKDVDDRESAPCAALTDG